MNSSLRPLVIFCVVAALAVVLFPALGAANAAEADVPAREAITRTIDQYIDGGRKGSSEVMRRAFHDGATIYTAKGGGPIQLLYDLVDKKDAAKEIPYRIATLEIAENIAMARVEIDNWAGAKYTDMFTLVKDGEQWKIVSKVSYTH